MNTNLAALRRAAGLTQMQVAKKLGCHIRLVARWEARDGIPSLRYAVKLAQVYGVSLDKIAQVADDTDEDDAAGAAAPTSEDPFLVHVNRTKSGSGQPFDAVAAKRELYDA